ncbi:MAG TPA: MMPL family transporter, partial [Polyangiaceae bacterium]|nr:MMPL family transporter [Polyangiaceae bacterium]
MGALGAFIVRRRVAVLLVAGAWFVVALVLLGWGGRLSTGAIHGLEAERAAQLAEAVVGRTTETTLVVIFESAGAEPVDPADPAFVGAMDRALAPLVHDPRVKSVTTPANAGPLMAWRMVDAPSHAAFALVALAGDVSDAAATYRALRPALRSDTLTITCTGHVAFMRDLDGILEHDLVRAEAVSLPICLVLLWAVFGGAIAASLPVCVGALAVVSGIAVVTVLSRVVDLAQYTINVCSLIGL